MKYSTLIRAGILYECPLCDSLVKYNNSIGEWKCLSCGSTWILRDLLITIEKRESEGIKILKKGE